MKKLKFSMFFCLYTMSFSNYAVNVGEVTSIMPPEKSILAKEVFNNTDIARYVSVTVEKLSSPMEGGVVIPMDSKSELLLTPASLILPGQTKENFRFIYKGPEDDKERYYRLSWVDEPVTEYNASQDHKYGQATTSAIIGTILVIAPRKENFNYKIKSGAITNTGNTTFRVISYGPCKVRSKDTGNGCRERYYVMPGVTVQIKYTDTANKKTKIGIWHKEQYINVN